MDATQKAYDALVRTRRTSQQGKEELLADNKKLKQENNNLRDILLSRQAHMDTTEAKLKMLEQQRQQQNEGVNKVKTLERENESLRNQIKFVEGQTIQIEGESQSIKAQNKELQKRYDDLDKQYLSLMQGGDSSRLQHFSHIKTQSNSNTKQLI